MKQRILSDKRELSACAHVWNVRRPNIENWSYQFASEYVLALDLFIGKMVEFLFLLIFLEFRLLISIDVPNSIDTFPMHFNPLRHPTMSLATSNWLIPHECLVYYMHTCSVCLTFSVFIQFEIHWICCRQISEMYIQLAVVTVSKTIRIQQRSTVFFVVVVVATVSRDNLLLFAVVVSYNS